MASITTLLLLTLFVALSSSRVTFQVCTLDNIKIEESLTGAKVKTVPEWKVTIYNDCICTQLHVKLSCAGFQSEEAIDPAILSKSGDACLVNNGDAIFGFKNNVTFNYAAAKQFLFKPIDSTIACS